MAQRHSAGLILLILLAGPGGVPLAGEEPETPAAEEPADPVSEEQPRDWQRELDAIADLLIDGDAAAAAERATALLATPDLPEPVAARAQELQQKAEAKQAPAAPAPPTTTPAAPTSSFKVRLAQIGRGFDQGTSGVLRLTGKGIDFVPAGRSRADWTIAWNHLVEARADEGIWDIPDPPLVLVERGGRKRYIARLDASGRCGSSDALLAAIKAGRRQEKTADRTPPP